MPAAAVEGRVNDLELIRHAAHHGRIDGHGHDLLEEGFVRLLAQILNESLLQGSVKGHTLDILEDVQLLHQIGNGSGVLGRQLRAV